MPKTGDGGNFTYPYTYGYIRRPAKKKKRTEEIKILDFVDSSKAIEGSSDEEEEEDQKEDAELEDEKIPVKSKEKLSKRSD